MATNKMMNRKKSDKKGVKIRSIEDLRQLRQKRMNASFMKPMEGKEDDTGMGGPMKPKKGRKDVPHK